MQITDFTFSEATFKTIGPDMYKCAENITVYVSCPAGKGWRFVIPKGFVTNFRSGTDLINPIIPRQGSEAMTICYVLHDFIYTYHLGFTKEMADELLNCMLEFEGTLGKIRRWFIFKALSLFGRWAWKEECTGLYRDNIGLTSEARIIVKE